MLAARIVMRCGRVQPSLFQGRQHFTTRAKLLAPEGRSSKIQSELPTFMKRLMAPAGKNAHRIGNAVVAGASAFALGSLCYYGLGLSNEAGTTDKHIYWSEAVRQHVKSTYAYMGGSVLITAASALAASNFKPLLNFMIRSPELTVVGSLVATVGSLMLCMSLPYTEGLGAKQLALVTFASVVGAVFCPVVFLEGPLLARAAAYTAGIVGGLSTIAYCAPSDKFLYIGAPLAMGLGVILVASLGSCLMPASMITTALGSGINWITLYGGLIVFGGYVLYDTQKIIHDAENDCPEEPFDPIIASLGIYLNVINIFIRMLDVLDKHTKRCRRR